jgi:hypothetical protein
MWKSLEPSIVMVQNTHEEMRQVSTYKTNYAQLVKYKDIFLNNTRHMAAFGKYFSFGKGSVSFQTKATFRII